MARTADYQQRFTIHAPRPEVWGYLVEPTRHVLLHPLMEDLTVVAEDHDEQGHERLALEVVDAVPVVGRWSVRVSYRATMTLYPAEYRLRVDAAAPLSVRTRVEWSLHDVGEGTCVDERVSITAPLGLLRYSLGQSQRSHAILFERLEARLRGS